MQEKELQEVEDDDLTLFDEFLSPKDREYATAFRRMEGVIPGAHFAIDDIEPMSRFLAIRLR
jgi:hypothetical protein